MRDIELFTLMRQQLVAQVPLRYADPLGYLMRYQPVQEGRPNAPTLWFYKVVDRRRGQRKTASKWNGAQMLRTEQQLMETTIQISATKDYTQNEALTPSDCVNIVCGVMQSDRWIESLRPQHVQVLRVSDVNMTRPLNDSDQWEEQPSFDITFMHTDTFVDGQPFVNTFTFDIYRI